MAREYADPYVYQGTGVLENIHGIRDENAFKQFEYEHTSMRDMELRGQPAPDKFDYAHLKAIHAHLFQDSFAWAGKPRTIDLSKAGVTFERPQNMEAAAQRINEKLEKLNDLQGLDKREFVDKFSSLFADLNALHPFREGNGRATRVFLSQLVRVAGFEMDCSRIDNDKKQFFLACDEVRRGDMGPLRAIFSQAIRPSEAVAFQILPRAEALKRHPELQSTYGSLDTLEKTLITRHPGNQKAQDHFLAQARTEALRKLDQGKSLMTVATPLLGGGFFGIKPLSRETLPAARAILRPAF